MTAEWLVQDVEGSCALPRPSATHVPSPSGRKPADPRKGVKVARAGIEPATFRFSGGRSYQLSYLAGRLRPSQPKCLAVMATLTGLEPATSAVTGRRANQLRHRALLRNHRTNVTRTPYGIRTRATALKGRRPRPLDEGGLSRISPGHSQQSLVGSVDSLGYTEPKPQTDRPNPTSILFKAPRPYSSVGRATDF